MEPVTFDTSTFDTSVGHCLPIEYEKVRSLPHALRWEFTGCAGTVRGCSYGGGATDAAYERKSETARDETTEMVQLMFDPQ